MASHTAESHSFNFSIEKTKGKSLHTFIFIHDIGFDKRFWFPIMTDIGDTVRTVAYDLNGFGANSTSRLPHHTLEQHVKDLFAVISHVRAKNPVLIGVRFGALVALHALRKDAARISGVMVGGTLPYTPTYEEYASGSELIAALPGAGSALYADRLIEGLNIDRSNSAQLRHQISTSNAENIAAVLTASLTRPSALHALLGFAHPICLLSGQDQDERIQKECISISLNQPNMSIVRIPESTTLYNLENPRAFRSALLRFIKRFEEE